QPGRQPAPANHGRGDCLVLAALPTEQCLESVVPETLCQRSEGHRAARALDGDDWWRGPSPSASAPALVVTRQRQKAGPLGFLDRMPAMPTIGRPSFTYVLAPEPP